MAGHLSVSDTEFPGPHGRPVKVRTYIPEYATSTGIVWAHGGGFAGGDIAMPEADWVSRELAARGSCVVSVDYRLAPVPAHWGDPSGDDGRARVHAPIPSEEVSAAFEWATLNDLGAGTGWALGGASAGGNLAACAALRILHHQMALPVLVVLAYPTVHATQMELDPAAQGALDADPDAPRSGFESVHAMYANYLGGAEPDLYTAPGLATTSELAGFPPSLIITSEIDPLRISAEVFAENLRTSGVTVDVWTEPGTRHGHLNQPEERAAAFSIDRIASALRSASVGPHS